MTCAVEHLYRHTHLCGWFCALHVLSLFFLKKNFTWWFANVNKANANYAHSLLSLKQLIMIGISSVESPRAGHTAHWLLLLVFGLVLLYKYIPFTALQNWIVSPPYMQMVDAFTLLMHPYLIFLNGYYCQSSVSRIILEEINVVDGKKIVMVWTRLFYSPIATTVSTYFLLVWFGGFFFRDLPTLPITEYFFYLFLCRWHKNK